MPVIYIFLVFDSYHECGTISLRKDGVKNMIIYDQIHSIIYTVEHQLWSRNAICNVGTLSWRSVFQNMLYHVMSCHYVKEGFNVCFSSFRVLMFLSRWPWNQYSIQYIPRIQKLPKFLENASKEVVRLVFEIADRSNLEISMMKRRNHKPYNDKKPLVYSIYCASHGQTFLRIKRSINRWHV